MPMICLHSIDGKSVAWRLYEEVKVFFVLARCLPVAHSLLEMDCSFPSLSS